MMIHSAAPFHRSITRANLPGGNMLIGVRPVPKHEQGDRRRRERRMIVEHELETLTSNFERGVIDEKEYDEAVDRLLSEQDQ